MEATTQTEETVEAADGATQTSAPAAANGEEKLREELAVAKKQAAEYLDGWQRSRAEFANYKRRQESDLGQARQYANATLVAKMLPVIDDFDRAARTLPDNLKHMTWIEGVMLIHRKLQLVLDGEGVKPIEVKPNDTFDPNQHEAISHDEADGIESGHVIEEVQRGYKLGERVLRPSLVRVAR